MTEERAAEPLPPLVQQARRLAEEMRFPLSSTPEVRRLLRLLASQFRGGRIGETGSGCGVGAAWVVSGLAADASFVTVEHDRERALAVQRLFASCPNVRVLSGDWRQILAHGPFDMLFPDGGPRLKGTPDGRRIIQPEDVNAILSALRPGGLIVLDDLIPEAEWPPEWRGKPDPTREFWLNDPRVHAGEILLSPNGRLASGVIFASRIE